VIGTDYMMEIQLCPLGFLVVVIGTDYMREIQLCPLGFLVVVIGTDYMREIQLCPLGFLVPKDFYYYYLTFQSIDVKRT
jgi:hypothetical protein